MDGFTNENIENTENTENEEINADLVTDNVNSINDTGNESGDIPENEQAPVNEGVSVESLLQDPTPMQKAHSSIQEKKEQLLASKVVHYGITFSDSGRMTRIKQAIPRLNNAMRDDIPKEGDRFDGKLQTILGAYKELIDACAVYVRNITKRRRGKSESGSVRLSLTKDILSQTEKESAVFELYARQYYEDYKDNNESHDWTDILYNARAEKVSTKDKNITMVGARNSNIFKRKGKDGKTTYIKQEERLLWTGNRGETINAYLASGAPNAEATVKAYKEAREELGDLMNDCWSSAFKAFFGFKKDYKADEETNEANLQKHINTCMGKIYRTFGDCKKEYVKEYISSDENKEQLKDFFAYVLKRQNEFYTNTKLAGIAVGSAISNRNASTSRMAERLGAEDVVAKSNTILMETDDGTMVKANEMEEVAASKPGQEIKTVSNCMNYAKNHKMEVEYTSNAILQSYKLQVLDLICGQIDRHFNNFSAIYHIETKKDGKQKIVIDEIKGYDNDMSFGVITLSQMYKLKTPQALFTDGKISVPYLPRDFYEKIMAYELDMADTDLMDIRSAEEIKSLKERFKSIKRQISNLVKSRKMFIVETPKQLAEVAKNVYAMQENDQLADSYLYLY